MSMKRTLSCLLLLWSLSSTVFAGGDLHLTAEEGTVPMLPAALWDGKEWRQVRWDNSARETEEAEAAMKAGSKYEVEGTLLGSGKTVKAHILFREDLPQYWNYEEKRLTVGTSSTIDIVKAASEVLGNIYRQGYHYKKAGVIVIKHDFS